MALYERRLTDSLGPINARTLARDIARDKPLDVAAWIEARDITLLGDASVNVLNDLYAEAAWFGTCIARAELEHARRQQKANNPAFDVDWSGWVPGDPDAARLLLQEAGTGIQGLLNKAGITIKGINDTRVSELGNLLARTVGEGASMNRTAAAIREQFGKGSAWAKTVAQTETRRAVTAASVDTYQAADVQSVEWLTAWGEACPICQEFQDMGPVLIGSGAYDGEDGPPGHPNCFCVILPVIDSELLRNVKSITKAGRNEVDAALKALDKIPDVEPGEIASPWVITRRPKLDNEEWRASVIKSVPITMLLASQPRLTRERVEHFILNPGSIEQGRRALPNVYDHGNEQVIVDGHHRLAALWLLGADHANVWLLEGSE
jgi:hypothetical protein